MIIDPYWYDVQLFKQRTSIMRSDAFYKHKIIAAFLHKYKRSILFSKLKLFKTTLGKN